MKDAAAAYQLALRWKLSETDGAQYADAAVAILNDWAKTCTGFIVNDKGEFIDPNEFLIFIQVHHPEKWRKFLTRYASGSQTMNHESLWKKLIFALVRITVVYLSLIHIYSANAVCLLPCRRILSIRG